jgi:hypothetical protein
MTERLHQLFSKAGTLIVLTYKQKNKIKALGQRAEVFGSHKEWRQWSFSVSFDHLVRSYQHIRRDRQADLFSRFQIDDEFELLRLLHREIGGLGAFKNLVDIRGGAPEQIRSVNAIVHEATGFSIFRL